MPEIEIATNRGPGKIRIGIGLLEAEQSTDRLRVGQGYNSLNGLQRMMNCVEYRGPDSMLAADAQGQRVEYVFRYVRDYTRLRKELNISAAASLGIGIYSASVAVDFERSESYSRLDTFLLVGVRVQNPAMVLADAYLTEAALSVMKLGQTEFVNRCGNSYVYGYVSGGELLGVVRYSATTEEQASKLRIQVEGAAQGYGKASFGMTEAMSKITEHTSTEFTLLRSGGAGEIPTPEDLAEKARNYPESVRDDANARILCYLTRSYQTVENLPHISLNFDNLERQAAAVEEISHYIAATYQRRNDWLRISEQPDQYVFAGDPRQTVDAALEALERERDRLFGLLDQIQRTGPLPLAAPALPTLPLEKPSADPLPVVTIWRDIYFTGQSADLNESIPELDAIGFQDALSSIRVRGKPSEYLVQLFIGGGYGGASYDILSPADVVTTHLVHGGAVFGDEVSSIRISKLQ